MMIRSALDKHISIDLITEEEFKNFVEDRPQKGSAVENAQGVSADVAAGAATAEVAEVHAVDKYLNYSLKEVKALLWHKQKDLERYGRDPDMPKETLGNVQKQVDDLEKQKMLRRPQTQD